MAARTSTARRCGHVPVWLGLLAGLLLNSAPIRRYGSNLSQPRAHPVEGDQYGRWKPRTNSATALSRRRAPPAKLVTVSPHLAMRQRWDVRASLWGAPWAQRHYI